MAATVPLNPPTTNFQIVYDPTLPNIVVNATQLAQTVELDFADLCDWFGITGGFGPGNRMTLSLIFQGGSGSNNHGYRDDGSTNLNLNGSPSGSPVADIVRMHFVAEFVEVLMDYNNQHGPETWHAGKSHGEGLSQFCAYLRATAGYISFYGTTFEEQWLENPGRPDWVSNTENTDGDVYSFGCAMLFLFYLSTQLGYAPKTIIQSGADTLANVYTKLTGRTDAAAAFFSLINRFFPPTNEKPYLHAVNPFPLFESAGRLVDITEALPQNTQLPFLLRHGHAVVSPFIGCPPRDYQFDLFDQPQAFSLIARAHGFASALFQWWVGRLMLTGTSGVVTVPITLTEKVPEISGGISTLKTTIDLNWTITPLSNVASGLVLAAAQPFGKYELDVGAQAYEESVDIKGTVTGTDTLRVDDSTVRWEPQFYADQKRCVAAFADRLRPYVLIDPFLQPLVIPPEPPGFDPFDEALRVLRRLAHALDGLAQAPPELQGRFDQLLHQRLGVSREALRDLTVQHPDRQ